MTNARLAEEIGYRIRDRRTGLGLKQEDLAADTGISRRAIQYFEAGASIPGTSAILSLCRRLVMSPDELLGWKDR